MIVVLLRGTVVIRLTTVADDYISFAGHLKVATGFPLSGSITYTPADV